MESQSSHKIRILHTSDTHLGDPYGHPISETAFAATVRAADSFNVDYMLIAGDVFDNARIKDSVISSFFNQVSGCLLYTSDAADE